MRGGGCRRALVWRDYTRGPLAGSAKPPTATARTVARTAHALTGRRSSRARTRTSTRRGAVETTTGAATTPEDKNTRRHEREHTSAQHYATNPSRHAELNHERCRQVPVTAPRSRLAAAVPAVGPGRPSCRPAHASIAQPPVRGGAAAAGGGATIRRACALQPPGAPRQGERGSLTRRRRPSRLRALPPALHIRRPRSPPPSSLF